MRRRLLYHASAVNPNPDPTPDPEVTVTGYELGISEFSYPTVKHSDTSVSPVFRYYYIPKYSDGTEGERVYITQEDETPDFLYVKFTLNSEYDANVREAETELDEKTGVLTFNEWSDYINNIGGYRIVAVVDMHVGYAPNGSDRAYADFPEVAAEQSSVDIYWHTPIVTLSYDDAPAQPDEEGGKIILKPTVKWTQEGYDDDGKTHTETSDEITNAQYVFSSTGDISVDVDGNVTVPSSTVEERHNVGTVTVKVTNKQVIDGEEQAGSDTCNIYQEAYTVVPEEVTLGTDVLLFDKDTRDNIIVPKGDFDYSKYDKSRYTPIGLVVIPRDHGVYGDNNTIGVLSLMDADLNNPAEGGTHGNTIYGMRDYAYPDNFIPYNVEDSVFNETSYIASNILWGGNRNIPVVSFPSDMYSGLPNKLDTETAYKDSTVDFGSPSPYNNNGRLNSLYIASAPDADEENPSVFQDFDGEEQSIDLLHSYNYQVQDGYTKQDGALKDDSVWRTSSNISFVDANEDLDGYYESYEKNYGNLPAMEACWRYSPENTHEGNWHLPSTGEWGYVIARAKAINDTLATLAREDLYGISYSDIGDYGYINSTLEMGELVSGVGYNNVNAYTGNFDGGFLAVLTHKKGIARPMMRLKATVSSGNIGNTPLPTGYDDIEANNFLDDNRHKSRWCIYRNESACNNEYYPSYNSSSSNNCKSGTVYGVLVKSDTDMTILKTDVELFSFDNLTCASGRLNRQFGYYNQDIEAGWYVIQKIEWDDGTTTANIYPPSVVVGNTLQPTQVSPDGWYGTVSIIYDYKNESQLGYDSYTKGTYNLILAAFRIGYWDKTTAILLHSQEHGSTEKNVSPVYDGGYGTDVYGSVSLKLPEITVDMSDDSLQTTVNYEQTKYTVTIPAGDPFIVGSKDVLRVTFPNTNYTGLGGGYEKFINNAYAASLYMHIMGNGDAFNDYELVHIESNKDVNTNLSISAMGKAAGYECTDTNSRYIITSSNYYNSSTGYVEFDMSHIGRLVFSDKCRVRLFLRITVAGLDESFSIPSETEIRLTDV